MSVFLWIYPFLVNSSMFYSILFTVGSVLQNLVFNCILIYPAIHCILKSGKIVSLIIFKILHHLCKDSVRLIPT